MKITKIGNPNGKRLMLLPGTFCAWETNFKTVIPFLKEHFLLLCVSYDGFTESEDSTFSSVMMQVEKIENYIIENEEGRLHAVYGSSLGGSLAGLLVSRNKITIDHAILGSSDLDQNNRLFAWLKTQMVTAIAYPIIQTGQVSTFVRKTIFRKASEKDITTLVEMVSPVRQWVKKKSCKKQFYSDLITPLPQNITGTDIHIFYAKKMGEKYCSRYTQHFPQAIIHEHDYKHEELLYSYPEKWCKLIKDICK